MKNITKADITAVILAGGQATRMNGQDKGLILFNDKPLIAYVADVINQDVHSILISANRNIDLYQEFGKVVSDRLSDFQGPLAGISAALDTIQTSHLLVLPCDGPFINGLLLERLLESMNQTNGNVCVATDRGRMHPTFALISASLKDNLTEFLLSGERKLGLWFRKNNALEVDFSDQKDMFINLNSPKDFEVNRN